MAAAPAAAGGEGGKAFRIFTTTKFPQIDLASRPSEIVGSTGIEFPIACGLEHAAKQKYPRIIMAIGQIRHTTQDPEVSRDGVVAGEIRDRVGRDVSGGRADGLVAVLKILRSDGVGDQA